jgi:hypothetical protein
MSFFLLPNNCSITPARHPSPTSSGGEPPNRVVILQFANMDAVKAWRQEGEADLESNVGNKYAGFRVYAVEGVAQ